MNHYKLKTRTKKSGVSQKPIEKIYRFDAKVWLYSGAAAWHFITVPTKVSRDIKSRYGFAGRGWGSLPVEAGIGRSLWTTSIFPDSKTGTYLLPLKSLIRKNEGIGKGSAVQVTLKLSIA